MAAVAGPTAARRNAGWRAAAGPARDAPLADVTTSQSNAASRAERGPQLHAAVRRIDDLDQRHVHDRRPHGNEAGPQLPRVRPGDGDPLPGQRAGHQPTTRRAWRGRLAGSLVVAGVEGEGDALVGGVVVAGEEPVQLVGRSTWAPTGSEQPEPSWRGSRARSRPRAASAAWSMAASSCSASPRRRCGTRRRRSPGRRPARTRRGSRRSAIRSVMPRTSSAATAITIAPPSGTFASRVWMLPRSSTNVRSGRTAASCARRRTDPVATVAPGASCVERSPDQARRRRSRRAAERADHQPVVRRRRAGPWPSARRCRRARRARRCWTSLTNTPWPPIVCSGTSWRRSPVVSTNTSSTVAARRAAASARRRRPRPGCAPARLAAGRQSARRGTRRAQSQVEQVAHGGGVALALRRAGVVLQTHRRPCSSLATMPLVTASTAARCVVVERRRGGRRTGRARLADRLGALVQLRHERRRLAGGDLDARTARPPR